MTEKFAKILEYQTLDMELRRLSREFNKLPEKKKLDVTRNKFNEAQSRLDTNAEEAEKLASEIERAYAEFKAAYETLEKTEKEYGAAATEEERAAFLPKLETLKSKLDSCKSRINGRTERIKQLTGVCMKALTEKKTFKEEFDKLKVKLDAYREEKLPERKRLEEKMKALEPTLDKSLYDMYIRYRNDGVAPVFVEVVGDSEKDYACRCGMQLSQTNKSELKNKTMCQCETCRRIVYLK